MLTWNLANMTRSRTRELELKVLLDTERPDVAALTEVELDAQDTSLHIPGYKIFYALPISNKIRVLMLLKESLVKSSSPSLIIASHQEIWIKFSRHAAGSWTVGAYYRQWSRHEGLDLDSFCDNIRRLSASSPYVTILGDFNLDVSRRSDPNYYRRLLLDKLLNFLSELGFHLENRLDSPTFFSHGHFLTPELDRIRRESVLDLVFTLGVRERPALQVLHAAATDHKPVVVDYPGRGPAAAGGIKELCRRDFKNIPRGALLMLVNATNLSRVFEEEDVDKILGMIMAEIHRALDLAAPVVSTLVKDRPDPLHLSYETRQTMQSRDRAAKMRDWQLYRKLRNKAAREVRRDRLQSNLDRLRKTAGDAKQLWQLADSMTGRARTGGLPARLSDGGKMVEGDDKLATVMNDFYIEKIARIRRGIEQERLSRAGQPQQQQQEQLQQRQHPTSFSFRMPTESETLRTIMGLRNTGALGDDAVPVGVLKEMAPALAAPMAHLARRSLTVGWFPSAFKIANVVPIIKKGKDPSLPASYRPVSLLPVLSKVLESLVQQQLSPYLSSLLPTSQWGFRKGRSTAAALAAAHASWSGHRAAGEVVGVAAFDFSSAFDTIGFGELVSKLDELGFSDGAKKWISHYLHGRRQRVRYGGCCSALQDVTCGVPQGSILGPTLFITLTYDLPKHLGLDEQSDGIAIYADDVTIWSAHKSADKVRERLEHLSLKLGEYALENSLALNASKTQAIWFGMSSPPLLLIGNSRIKPQEELQLLGITFNNRMSLAPHLRSLEGTAKSLSALTRRLLLHLPRGQQVCEVVRALVSGRVCYGSILFPLRLSDDDSVSQLMQAIQVQVNNIARQLLGVTRADKMLVEDMLYLTGLPSLNRFAVRAATIALWKSLKSCDGPGGAKNPLGTYLVSPSSSSRLTRSVTAGDLPPPLRKRTETYVWHAVKIYNMIPSLRSASSLASVQRLADSFSSSVPL